VAAAMDAVGYDPEAAVQYSHEQMTELAGRAMELMVKSKGDLQPLSKYATFTLTATGKKNYNI
jgi:hypothetical protein